MRLHRHRPHARPAAAVRDAERLVQVEVRDVGAEVPRRRDADQCVQVRAVDVHLSAVRVHDLAHPGDAGLEHAVRRRVRHHDRGEVAGVGRRLALEVGEVHVAVRVAAHDDDLHAGHLRRRRVRAVRRRRDQADVAMPLAAGGVVRADDEQARVLPLRAGVGLQRHGVVAGAGADHLLQLRDQLDVARGLVARRERVHVRELAPRHRHHLGGRVELHRARAERDHRAVERQVAIGEPAQVAQHLGLGPVATEHRVFEERRRPRECRGQRVRRAGVQVRDGERHVVAREREQDPLDVLRASWSRRATAGSWCRRRARSSCRARPLRRGCARCARR